MDEQPELTRLNRAELIAFVRETIGREGYEVLLQKVVGNNVLQVWVDGEQGVNVDDTARLSRTLRDALEEGALDAGDYQIELQSPGLDRPLVRAEHFARFAGERVHVRLKERRIDRSNFKGQLLGIDEQGVIRVQGDELWEFTLDELQETRVIPNFDKLLGKAPQATGRTRKPRKSKRKKPKKR